MELKIAFEAHWSICWFHYAFQARQQRATEKSRARTHRRAAKLFLELLHKGDPIAKLEFERHKQLADALEAAANAHPTPTDPPGTPAVKTPAPSLQRLSQDADYGKELIKDLAIVLFTTMQSPSWSKVFTRALPPILASIKRQLGPAAPTRGMKDPYRRFKAFRRTQEAKERLDGDEVLTWWHFELFHRDKRFGGRRSCPKEWPHPSRVGKLVS